MSIPFSQPRPHDHADTAPRMYPTPVRRSTPLIKSVLQLSGQFHFVLGEYKCAR
ncbi:hypothetical protein CALVIDRAFT_535243 [Calocera viscosa TUFC12733]|uniref:Uncharacterized protein n=1 Tax=Calocera viscosa (strain TUFC12733) TaxID=1330018 RepID=A0A167PBH4_CALVF|nr:hypothetical protein CALVIDRAFT_543332 [Calocera viscosa TUFC12733]KZO98623.1 hypothetical protein CALVIDRAFT_535243 [Calocera viscosa TUFC12733]